MQIGLSHRATTPPPTPPPVPGVPRQGDVEPLDTFETAQALSSSVAYKLFKLKAKLLSKVTGVLQDQPKVLLHKPLVCVQGFRSKPGGFAPLFEHLTEGGRNGGKAYYVKGGKIFEDVECARQVKASRVPDARVFRVLPHNRMQSFDVTADQLVEEMKAIEKFTGEKRPDVLAHSMGGLSVRRYLDKHPVQIGKLVMLGTPHLGTKNADFARKVLAHNVGWAMAIGGISHIAAPAVEALRAIHQSENANPFLKAMNDRWPQQEAKTEGALTLGGAGYCTPSHDPDGSGDGDALVEASALQLASHDVRVLPGRGSKLHHTLPVDDDVFQEMKSFFEWK